MPVNLPGLTSDLEALLEAPLATELECAQAWGDAMRDYALGMVPVCTTQAAAGAALTAGLAGMSADDAAEDLFKQAFKDYALAIKGGLATAPNATVPPGDFIIPVVPDPGTLDAAAAAASIATAINAWFITGNAGPPSPAPWA